MNKYCWRMAFDQGNLSGFDASGEVGFNRIATPEGAFPRSADERKRPQPRARLSVPPVKREQAILAAQKQPLAREHRRNPAGVVKLRNLERRNLLGWSEFRGKQSQLSALAQGNEFAIRQNGRTAAINGGCALAPAGG
jgi:hypothetical protein